MAKIQPPKPEPVKPEIKKEEPKKELPPKEEAKPLVEIKGQAPSEAEIKKLEELRRLKEQAKLNKSPSKKPDSKGVDLPKINAPSLPPVMMHRKGQFDMIPDFLKDKKVQKDMNTVQERDLLQEALDKQSADNEQSGLSMKELFEKKRREAEE